VALDPGLLDLDTEMNEAEISSLSLYIHHTSHGGEGGYVVTGSKFSPPHININIYVGCKTALQVLVVPVMIHRKEMRE
jgi:hypothetical protein